MEKLMNTQLTKIKFCTTVFQFYQFTTDVWPHMVCVTPPPPPVIYIDDHHHVGRCLQIVQRTANNTTIIPSILSQQ